MGVSPELAMSLARDECLDDRPGSTSAEVTSSVLARALRAQEQEPPGLVLQRRREERGLTLEDLSRTTKINKATLHALESSDLLHLPAPIYTRGFIKAYAREVGLNPDTTADDYLRRIAPLRAHDPLVDDVAPPPADHARSDEADDARNLLALNQVRRFNRLPLIVAAVALVVYLTTFPSDDADSFDAADGSAADTSESSDAADALDAPDPTRTGGADGEHAQQDATAAIAGSPLRVELVTQGECWVSISIDGEQVLAKLFAAGERQTLDIGQEAVLRVGEPSALSLSINGQWSRPLGPAGQPVTVRITRHNFREFLSS